MNLNATLVLFKIKGDKLKHLENRAFFDGEVELQRFDIVRHPQLEKLNTMMLSFFWRPEEVDVSKDKLDFDTLDDNQKHIFLSNLKRQIVLDTKQGREPLKAFLPLASSPENECAITEWSFQELIHSRSYTHIIQGVLSDPSTVFDTVFDIEEIVDLADSISKYYDELIKFNEQLAILMGDHNSTIKQAVHLAYNGYEHKKAFWKALVAVNALEGIRFYVSFACSWAFAEVLDKMEGNAKIIKLICRDENLHLKLTQTYLTRILREDENFVKIKKETEDECLQIVLDVVEQEKQWASYLFKDGGMLGLNEEICCDYIDWLADKRLSAIGMKYPYSVPSKNPLPWTSHWIAGDIKQTALQETESDSYLVGIVSGSMDDAADKLRVMFPEIAKKEVYNVTYYSKEGCTFCLKTEEYLSKLELEVDQRKVGEGYTVDDYKMAVPSYHNTYPAIFVDGVFIGGYEDLITTI